MKNKDFIDYIEDIVGVGMHEMDYATSLGLKYAASMKMSFTSQRNRRRL